MNDYVKAIVAAIIGGIFTFSGVIWAFSKENDKAVINQRHEIAINQLIPNIYNPLLKVLEDYEGKKALGRFVQLNTLEIMKILDANMYMIFFTPEDIQFIVNRIRQLCYSVTNPGSKDIKVQDDLIIEQLQSLKLKLKEKFAQYTL